MILPGVSPDDAPFHFCRFNVEWLPFIIGALEMLDVDAAWNPDAQGQVDQLIAQVAVEYEPLLPGMIMPYAGAAAPPGWLMCDGSAVSRTTYANLFSVLGTAFGAGDGVETFNLPDLRGRTPVGAGGGQGLTNRALAAKFGEENHILEISEMPSHSHNARWEVGAAYGGNWGGWTYESTPKLSGYMIENTGGNQPHNNMQPSLALNFIVYAG